MTGAVCTVKVAVCTFMVTVCTVKVAVCTVKVAVCTVKVAVCTRLLHPQHLDGIWIGQNRYRLPLAPLNEYPEPWC